MVAPVDGDTGPGGDAPSGPGSPTVPDSPPEPSRELSERPSDGEGTRPGGLTADLYADLYQGPKKGIRFVVKARGKLGKRSVRISWTVTLNNMVKGGGVFWAPSGGNADVGNWTCQRGRWDGRAQSEDGVYEAAGPLEIDDCEEDEDVKEKSGWKSPVFSPQPVPKKSPKACSVFLRPVITWCR
jgi:hypothetical protein